MFLIKLVLTQRPSVRNYPLVSTKILGKKRYILHWESSKRKKSPGQLHFYSAS